MRGFGSQPVDGEIAREALLCSECGICEKYACPMLISPREINVQIKEQLRAQGVSPAVGALSQRRAIRKDRLVPTSRLLTRLDIDRYHCRPEFDRREIVPERIILNLRQHIGVPAVPVVHLGDLVHCGDLVGEIPAGALGARIHCGIDGVVIAVNSETMIIERHSGGPS
jgi:Na+-translocating ferredoxin:NAD+ oxidoreductase RnfC subunit